MLASYVWRDLVRNPRRTAAALVGITLGVGLFSAILFFIDGSSASMTQRAVQPLAIDLQRVLTAPLGDRLRLTQTLDPPGRPAAGERVTVRLRLTNDSAGAANEVVVRSEPPAGLTYVPGSASRNGVPLPLGRTMNPFAQGAARTGLNLGTVRPGAAVALSYQVAAGSAADPAGFRTSFSTREIITPVAANTPAPVGPHELAVRIARIDGVASADELSFVDLPAGSVSGGTGRASGSLRLFGFDAGYQRRYGAIDVVAGRQVRGQAMVSLEAARALGVRPGDTVVLSVPGGAARIRLPVSGTVDLSRARALFSSRQGSSLEKFLYVPQSLVIDPGLFEDRIVPALLQASGDRDGGGVGAPIREVDVRVVRSRLDADPGTALAQSRRIAAGVTAVAPGQDYLIDNLSNTLRVARADAGVAKRMFVFLGVPGAVMAAVLAAYAGVVLAGAQRREQAILRIRGAGRRHLLTMLALRSALLTAAGSLLGLALGLATALVVLGAGPLGRASTPGLIASGAIGVGGGFLATGTALYAVGRAAIRREINDDRARVFSSAPRWWRARLDLVAVAAVAVLAALALWAHAFDGRPGSVYSSRGVRLAVWLLALPVAAWLGGSLLGGRAFARVLSALPARSPSRGIVRALLGRSLGRRSWEAAQGMVVVGLVVAAATSILAFTASYDRAKAADARFTLGSDIRVTPSPGAAESRDGGYVQRLEAVTGIAAATPVGYGVENALLRSNDNEDAVNLAAIDPSSFLRVAALDERTFVGSTAREALAALDGDPDGALLSTDMADFLSAAPGDQILVVFGGAGGATAPAPARLHVLGLFERLPGFPDGADAVVTLARERGAVPSTTPDFYLARTTGGSDAALTAAVAGLDDGPGRGMTIDTRRTTFAKDQSSLAALNIRGLLRLDLGYALAMAAVAIGIFVFGLLLQRRREYVTMRAQGMQAREIRALVVAETGTVTVAGCAAGLGVGVGMAFFLVAVLRPLFVLRPFLVLPAGGVAVLVLLVATATLGASLAAGALIGRLKPTELLRDE